MLSCISPIFHYYCSIQIWKVLCLRVGNEFFFHFPFTLFGGFEIFNRKVNRQNFVPAKAYFALLCWLPFTYANCHVSFNFVNLINQDVLLVLQQNQFCQMSEKKVEEPSRCPLNSFFRSKQQQYVGSKDAYRHLYFCKESWLFMRLWNAILHLIFLTFLRR